MRLKLVTLLSLCLLLSAVFQQVTLAQDAPPARTIPIVSKGFSAKLSPDGKTLVTFENIILLDLKEVDPTLLPMRVIDISSGKERGQLSGFTDYAGDVVFSSDGRKLISIHMNGDINIWDMASMKVLKTIQTPLLGTTRIKIFPDNKRVLILFFSTPAHLAVIDTNSGAITQIIGKHFDSFLDFQANFEQFPAQGDLQYAAFTLSPDGKFVAISTINDEVGLWSLADNQYEVIRKKSEQYGLFSIRQMVFTPDDKSLVYYDASDKQTRIWDIIGKSEKAKIAIGSDTFVLSSDGKMVAWATREKGEAHTISVAPLDAPDQAKVILTLPDGLQVTPLVTWLAFTSKGKQIVTGGFYADDETKNQIYVLDVPS